MTFIFRLLVVLIAISATFHFIYWVPFSLFPFVVPPVIQYIVSLLCALVIGWYIWTSSDSWPSGLISSSISGAVLIGSIGFCVGFFGPMIFTPESNQGPLLGILITGPAGFILGGIGGLLYRIIKIRKGR